MGARRREEGRAGRHADHVPDGATAELVYPADLALEEPNFYPDTYGVLDGKSSSCGWPVHASRHDPRGGWVRGDEPLDRYVTKT